MSNNEVRTILDAALSRVAGSTAISVLADPEIVARVEIVARNLQNRAAVFSIFSNLSPFVQFVGRIMRVIVQNSPGHILNQGVVVFHAGANIACQWADFQAYSEADRDYFDQLLPLEGIDPDDQQAEREVEPVPRPGNVIDVRAQSDVLLEEIPLLLVIATFHKYYASLLSGRSKVTSLPHPDVVQTK